MQVDIDSVGQFVLGFMDFLKHLCALQVKNPLDLVILWAEKYLARKRKNEA